MAKAKELLAAGYVRDIRFRSKNDCELYIFQLDHRHIQYEILDRYEPEDGSVIIRILQQYNNSPLIRLFDEQ